VSLASAVANRAYVAGAVPSRLRLEYALRHPARAQRAILARILRENAGTEFGRAHDFAGIGTVEGYRARVPFGDADTFAPYVARIARGEHGVLTAAPVRALEPTSGSSGAAKLVPYTSALLEEFSAATVPWIFDLLTGRPGLRNGRAYWAITPPGRHARRSEGGLPIGLEHDSDYFPAFARALLDRVLGMPRALSRAPDVPTCRYLTLRALLAMPDLAMISVWSPSFLTLLTESLYDHYDELLHDLAHGSLGVTIDAALRMELARALPARPDVATRLRRRFGHAPPDDLGELWTRLGLISCWTDGHAARALAGLRRRFPRVEVQGKGLIATEGVVSFPMFDAPGPVAAVTSHFIELAPAEAPDRPVTLDRAERDATYEVVLTTSGGFYRYRLRDLVRVEGFYRTTPVLRFVGRADCASDLAGEKLTPAFVETALTTAQRDAHVLPGFAMLAPAWASPPEYRLFVDLDAPSAERLAAAVEVELARSYHYELCRSLGQLAPVRAAPISDAASRYERACLARGQRAGTIKPPALDARLGWEHDLAAASASEAAPEVLA